MKKIIWVDVGTHIAQEYKSAFGSELSFLKIILRGFFGSIIYRRGDFIGFKNVYLLLLNRKKLNLIKSQFRFAFVEANSQLIRSREYRHASDIFCLALADRSEINFEINRLYHANYDSKSQGSSIYLEKNNISPSEFTLCPVVSADAFAKSYKVFLVSTYKDYEVILRINCEGSEDSVIYAFTENFGDKFNLILGSLKDVRGVKGDVAYSKLMNHIKRYDIQHIKFSADVNTWQDAHKALLKIASH